MKKAKYKVGKVFISAGYPEITYLERKELNKAIEKAKNNPSKHLFISGDSKSGKSTLWKRNYLEDEILKIPINKDSNISGIYKEILDKLNVYYNDTFTNGNKESASIKAKISTLLAVFKSELDAEITVSTCSTTTGKRMVDPIITASKIASVLKLSEKKIILEDFHYANNALIDILAQDLKVFSDECCQFIIISITNMSKEFLKSNSELSGRMTSIEVDMFTKDELKEVIKLGEGALNISISKQIVESIVHESLNSAAILQDICQTLCIEADVYDTKDTIVIIDDMEILEKAYNRVAYEQEALYSSIIKIILRNNHGNLKTQIYKSIIEVLKEKVIPKEGIKSAEFRKYIQEVCHEDISIPSVANGLRYVVKKTKEEGFNEIFNYNPENTRFFVNDKYFYFTLKWCINIMDCSDYN